MLTSILHRVAGVGLMAAISCSAFGLWRLRRRMTLRSTRRLARSCRGPIGQHGMYLLVASLAFHLGNGIRHFVFDSGAGLKPVDADLSAWFVILFAIAAPIAMWALVTFGV